MTLAFSEQRRGGLGKKMLKAFLVTLDGATTAITAAELDLHYIDSAMITSVSVASNIAAYLCTGAGSSIELGTTHANGDQINLWVWGY